MASTGPQKIPGASLAHFYGTGQYSGSAMEVNCGVAHTTESWTLPGYSGGSIAPAVTGLPDIGAKKIRWYQHYDVDESARALANKLGGVQTNTNNVFQIELVGTCDDSKLTSWSGKRAGTDYLHWPTSPDWALAEVAWLVRWLHDNHGVPMTCVKDWLAYGKDSRRPGVTPASYGANPARMTFAQWNAFKGWCGHQHVPENDHGDPGSLDFARIIALAAGSGGPAPSNEEDPMAGMTKKDIADAVLNTDGVFGVPASWRTANPTNTEWKFSSVIVNIGDQVRALTGKVDAQSQTIDKLVDAVAKLSSSVGDLDPAAVVAELRAAIESIDIRLDVPDQPSA